MDEQSVGLSDPPLTRRELRRREEAAHALERGQEAARQELLPPAPVQPVPASPVPRNSPSGRVPQWAIDDAAGETPQNTVWREAPAPLGYDWESGQPGSEHAAYVPTAVRYPSPVKRFFRALGRTLSDIFNGLGSFLKFLVLAGVLIVAIWNALIHFAPGVAGDIERAITSYGIINPFPEILPGAGPSSNSGNGAPPPGAGASDQPLGVPAATAASSSSYAFLRAGTDQPFVSYDPCRPIHYVVRPDNAPAGGDQAITEAVAAVSRATGFVFINDGKTSEAPALDRPAYQPDRYGDRWAPVLFAWETTWEQPQFTENWAPGSSTTLGLGGSLAVTIDKGGSAYVTGQLRLNSAALGTISRRADGHTKVRSVVQHELAHVVGLDHIADPTQLMSATMTDQVTDFAAGDLAGLAILGTGKCRPEL